MRKGFWLEGVYAFWLMFSLSLFMNLKFTDWQLYMIFIPTVILVEITRGADR